MDDRFDDLYTDPENRTFAVVFPPDRVYHPRHLSAMRSSRYRYNVREVRGSADVTVMKADVYLSGVRLGASLRVEYGAARLAERARGRHRTLGPTITGTVRVEARGGGPAQVPVTLHWDPVVWAYAVEIWETLEAPPGSHHDHRVLEIMGRDAPITRFAEISPALTDLRSLGRVRVTFSEAPTVWPTGERTDAPETDDNYRRQHQELRSDEPSAPVNDVVDGDYLLDFQRGWYLRDSGTVKPVRYRNALMADDDPERADDNIIHVRWLLQNELGSDLTYFHEVTVPPGRVEGTHRHIGSEELYYVQSGHGVAYLADGDDPTVGDDHPLVTRPVYGLDPVACRAVPVGPRSVIYTKSGGVHGIRNDDPDEDLRFVAFATQTT